jgi:hypothetical protein
MGAINNAKHTVVSSSIWQKLDEKSKGYEMLVKMGWTGTALGKIL